MDLKKFLKPKKVFKKGGLHKNPNVVWQFMVAIATILIISLFAFGARMYLATKTSLEAPPPSPQPPQIKVERDRIEATLKYFSDKRAESEIIIFEPAKVVDPSL